MPEQLKPAPVRLATLRELRQTTLPNIIHPIPTDETLRAMFDAANIPRLKANPQARRGGGTVYYVVHAVEKLFRSRLLPGRIRPATAVNGEGQ